MRLATAMMLVVLLGTGIACDEQGAGVDPSTLTLGKPEGNAPPLTVPAPSGGLPGPIGGTPGPGDGDGDGDSGGESGSGSDVAGDDDDAGDDGGPVVDTDQDGVPDAADNCPQHKNPNQLNIANHPTLGDRCNVAIVWVAPTGNDTNDGTYDHPLKTVDHAGDLAKKTGKSGHIFVHKGTYDGSVSLQGGMTLAGGFATDDGQVVHDATAYKTILTHQQNGAVVKISDGPGAAPAVIRDLTIAHTHPTDAGGISIKDVSTSIQNAIITIQSLKDAYGIFVNMLAQPHQQFDLESTTIQVNPTQNPAATGLAAGVMMYNFDPANHYTVHAMENQITVGAAELALGVAVFEKESVSELWIRRNTIQVSNASTAIGIALGWEQTLSAKLPLDAVAGDTGALDQNSIQVTGTTNAIGVLALGTQSTRIANNFVQATGIGVGFATVGIKGRKLADDTLLFANTIRVGGGDSVTAIDLANATGETDRTYLINNLIEVLPGAVTRRALAIANVKSIPLMTHNYVSNGSAVIYYQQTAPDSFTAKTPVALDHLIDLNPGKLPVSSTFSAATAKLGDAQFTSGNEPAIANESAAHDTGFDPAILPGADPQAAGFQEIAVDVFNTPRPQGQGWDVGAFEQ